MSPKERADAAIGEATALGQRLRRLLGPAPFDELEKAFVAALIEAVADEAMGAARTAEACGHALGMLVADRIRERVGR